VKVGEKNLSSVGCFSCLVEDIPDDAKYIMFCNQDDYWHSDKISKTLEKMLDMESRYKDSPVLVHADLSVVDKNLHAISPSFWRYQGLDVNCTELNRPNMGQFCPIQVNLTEYLLSDIAL
jgi:hypothetical protein